MGLVFFGFGFVLFFGFLFVLFLVLFVFGFCMIEKVVFIHNDIHTQDTQDTYLID